MKELAARANMSPQLLNKHAASLERSGLVTRHAHGRETRALAHPEVLIAAQEWIRTMTEYWDSQFDALEDYIASLNDRKQD